MLVLICLVMAMTSTVESSDNFTYPKGLPCKVYNTIQLDCSLRDLTNMPALYDRNVKSLDLSHNQIGTVDATKFIHLGSVELLDLSYNQLSTVSGTSFVHLISLEEVNLSWNKIGKVLFNVTLPLRILNLSFQTISYSKTLEIKAETFSGLQRLEVLDLTAKVKEIWPFNKYRNNLRFVGSPFQSTPSLKSLYLSGNTLYGLTSFTFSGLKQLQKLDMHRISYVYEPLQSWNMFPDLLFQDLHELRILNMSINHEESPTNTTLPILQSIRNLQHLNLSGYRSSIPLEPTQFNGLFSLEYLDLSRSRFLGVLGSAAETQFFPISLFNDLINLKYLDVSDCESYSLPDFMNLTSLKYLDISGNYLDSTQIECNVLEPLHSLSTLIVSPKSDMDKMNVSCDLTLKNFTNLSYLNISASLCKLDKDSVESRTSNGDLLYNHSVYKSLSDIAGFQNFVRWSSQIRFLHVKTDISSCMPCQSCTPRLFNTSDSFMSIEDDAFASFPYLTELDISEFNSVVKGHPTWKLLIWPHAFRGLKHLQKTISK